eukprot:jgi/Chlat1/1106/Chrsp110S01592
MQRRAALLIGQVSTARKQASLKETMERGEQTAPITTSQAQFTETQEEREQSSSAASTSEPTSDAHEDTLNGSVHAHVHGIPRETLVKLLQSRSMESLAEYGGVQGLAAGLQVDTNVGLPEHDTEFLRQRGEQYGSNTYPERQSKSFWDYLVEASEDTTLRILAAAAAVSFAVEEVAEHSSDGWYDSAGIVFAIVIVLLVSAGNNYNQSLQFQELNKRKKNITVKATRGGRRVELSIYDILVGDIIHINTGDQVPADGVLVEGFSVVCDESSMTGESEPVNKDAHVRPFLLSGTKVADGYGTMLVTAVGMDTEWGSVMSSVSEDQAEETPLQQRLGNTATAIGNIGLAVAVLVFAILLGKYFIENMHLSILSFSSVDLHNVVKFFAIAVTIVVVAVPEGLPLAVTLSLAYSMRQMAKDNALVRKLAACETMGGVNTICSDKTGTLTTNKMVVARSWLAGCIYHDDVPAHHVADIVLNITKEAICTNSDGNVFVTAEGRVEIAGKPTEYAVLLYGTQMGADFKAERAKAQFLRVVPFNSSKKRMGVLVQAEDGLKRMHWKGAAEIGLKNCTKMMVPDGSVVDITPEKMEELQGMVLGMAEESLRTLALTYCDVAAEHEADGLSEEALPDKESTLLCVVGIKDPCRPGVPAAVRECQSAGIKVRMVTGDYIVTAKAIARECGILTDNGIAMEGPEFRKLSKEQMMEIVPRLEVLARSSPTDKYTLVKLLREMGEVVAVTGDGTNDAPALHEADIGLAMGIAGTEIAKESSDVVILDDNFATIVTVVRWGRSVFENIRKFVQFQLTVNVVALTLNFVSAATMGVAPLTAVQLLWVNLIMDTMGALALGTEPPTERLMSRKPYGRTEELISNTMWRNMITQIIFQLIVLFGIQLFGYELFGLERPPFGMGQIEASNVWNDAKVLDTLIFNVFVFLQVFNELSARDLERINVFDGILNNKVFLGVIGFTVSCQYLIVQFLSTFASTQPLTSQQWIASVLVGSLSLPVTAVAKMVHVPEAPNLMRVVKNRWRKLLAQDKSQG